MGSNSLTMMEGTEAFGGGKVGGSFDPLNFLKKPCVVFRIAALLFSVIAFGCISSKAWQFEPEKDKEVCIMNDSSTACQLGNGVAIIAFLASIGFLVGEYFFEQMSSVKSRKHFDLADLAFSGFWAFAYLVSFATMAYQWSQSEEPAMPAAPDEQQPTLQHLLINIGLAFEPVEHMTLYATLCTLRSRDVSCDSESS